MSELYHQEDVQEILQLAIARQTDQAELTRTQLLEIADELGISTHDLALAEQEWQTRRGELIEHKTFQDLRHKEFWQHAIKYLIVNGFLITLDLLLGGGLSWSRFVLLGWGLGLALQGWNAHQIDTPKYNEQFQKWRRKQQVKRSFGRLLDRVLNV